MRLFNYITPIISVLGAVISWFYAWKNFRLHTKAHVFLDVKVWNFGTRLSLLCNILHSGGATINIVEIRYRLISKDGEELFEDFGAKEVAGYDVGVPIERELRLPRALSVGSISAIIEIFPFDKMGRSALTFRKADVDLIKITVKYQVFEKTQEKEVIYRLFDE